MTSVETLKTLGIPYPIMLDEIPERMLGRFR
jgi:hypothetical protein